MNRYFFDVIDDDVVAEDPEGAEFPDLDAVREEALGAARELLCEDVEAGRPVDRRYIQVRDASGQVFFKTPLIAALKPST